MKTQNNTIISFVKERKQIMTFLIVTVLVAVVVIVASSTPALAVHHEINIFETENYKLTFYGFINVAVMYDSNGAKGIDWAFASRNSGEDDDSLEFNVDNSRVGLLFKTSERNVLDSLNAEFDFVSRASGDTLRIRNLYADFKVSNWNILVGQSWRTILTNVGPSTLSTTWLWGQGNPYNLMPQLRATGHFGDIDVNLVAMQQKDKMGDIIGDGTIKSNQPNIGADISYKNGPFVASVGGSVGKVRVISNDEETYVTSWLIGVEAAVSIPIGTDSKVSLGGKVFTGSGGGLGTGAGQFAVIDTSNEAHSIDTTGGFVDLGLDLGKAHIHGIYGIDNPEDEVENVAVDRKKNQTFMGNISYDVTETVTVGLEFQRVETEYTVSTEDTDENNRLYATIFYKW